MIRKRKNNAHRGETSGEKEMIWKTKKTLKNTLVILF
jgi:hypothetical protein